MIFNTPFLGSARLLSGLSACNLTPPIQTALCCQHTREGQAGCVLALLILQWLPSVLNMTTTLTAQSWCGTYLGLQLPLPSFSMDSGSSEASLGYRNLHFLLQKGRLLGLWVFGSLYKLLLPFHGKSYPLPPDQYLLISQGP